LYHVDRDALFSYHKLSEAFLQKLMGLYTSAHYKNTPNDLQMLSDAPAHSVFCLLSPSAEQDGDSLPDILAVVQVALEGRISRKAVEAQLARGHRSAGDLIPWTISQQFGDSNFAQLSGARIVRIAVHPSVQGMGYGSRAIELLYRFYNGEMFSLSSSPDNEDEDGSKKESSDEEDDETNESDSNDESDNGKKSGKKKGIMNEKLAPKKELPPLLLPLTEVKAPRLDWLGTSFGLTAQLFQFWKRAGMRMLYLRQTKNELTGEHSSILVKALPKRTGFDDAWLPAFVSDSQRRITSLLAGPFRDTDVKLAVAILEDFGSINTASENKEANLEIAKRAGSSVEKMTATELQCFLTPHDMKRLELYGRNLCDHHLVTDLLPSVARLYFTGRFGADFSLSSLQGALLCGVGLQNKTIDTLTGEFGLPANQVLAMFNKGVRKISKALQSVVEEAESKRSLLGEDARLEAEQKALKMKNVSHQTLEEDAREGATVAMAKLTGYVIPLSNLYFPSFHPYRLLVVSFVSYHVACIFLVV
jgi:N-acetyltransferase 10